MKKLIYAVLCLAILGFGFVNVFGQWTECNNGIYGASIYSMAIDGNNIYAGTGGRGIFMSTDKGTNWTEINNGIFSGEWIFSFAINGNKIFATGTGGVYLSTNNGTTWTQINDGMQNTYITSISASGNNVVAGSQGGEVYYSSNNGTSWSDIKINITNGDVNSIVISGSYFFVGTTSGIFLTTNYGASWSEIDNGLTYKNANAIYLNKGRLFAASYGGVYVSSNNGNSWNDITNNIGVTSVLTIFIDNNNIYAGTSQGFYSSSNGGSSWVGVSSNIIRWESINAIAASADNIYIGSAYGIGVVQSTDKGSTWNKINKGITNTKVNTLDIKGNYIIAGTDNGIYLSTDSGNSWTLSGNGIWDYVHSIRAVTFKNNNIFAGTDYGIFLSMDNGSSWTSKNAGIIGAVNSFAISDTNLYAGTSSGVFSSTDNGSTWTQINNGLTNTTVYALTAIGNKIFAGTDNGIFLSTNNGTLWSPVNDGLRNYNTIKALATKGKDIYAAVFGWLYKSSNYGISWDSVFYSSGLNINTIKVLGNNIFVGERGVRYTTDNGKTWSQPDYTANICKSIGIYQNLIFYGSDGKGCYKMVADFLNSFDLSISGEQTVCPNDTSEYSTTSEKDVSIQWRVDNGSMIGSKNDTSVKVLWNIPGIGNVVLIKEDTKLAKTDSSAFQVTINPIPPKPTITKNLNTLISSDTSGNQWYLNDTIIQGATNPTYDASVNGKYSVQSTKYGGCSSEMSDEYDFVYTGVNDLSFDNTISIYQNSPENRLSIVSNSNLPLGTIEIYNILGTKIYSKEIPQSRAELDISSYQPGVYFIKKGNYQKMFVKY